MREKIISRPRWSTWIFSVAAPNTACGTPGADPLLVTSGQQWNMNKDPDIEVAAQISCLQAHLEQITRRNVNEPIRRALDE